MKNERLKEAFSTLANHSDPDVRACIALIKETTDRRKRIIQLVRESISQIRLDMKYLVFDLECTRRERDEAQGAV